jgi:3-oxoacyl-[acyl-carrier protein] reductase
VGGGTGRIASGAVDIRFDGQTILVTGASGGIGAQLAQAFASSGGDVVVHYAHGDETASALVEAIGGQGGKSYAIAADLSRPDGPEELIAEVRARSGRLDVLVNNAGGQVRRAQIVETDDALYEELLALNLTSVFRTCRAAIPLLAETGGGAIVNISSVSARNGGGGGSVVYSSAKAAVSTLTRGLAKELVAKRIRVNAVAPGLVDTPFHEATPRATWDALVAGIPMGRAGRADEMVGPVLFLASEQAASYVNGQSLEVNGAQYMP